MNKFRNIAQIKIAHLHQFLENCFFRTFDIGLFLMQNETKNAISVSSAIVLSNFLYLCNQRTYTALIVNYSNRA